MENTDTVQLEDEHINKNSGNEKADLYNILNTCRQYKKHVTKDQVVSFVSRVKDQANMTLFLTDIGKFIKDFDYLVLKAIVEACKFAKAKRESCDHMAKYLPAETSDEQKEEVAAVITAAFERNKARTSLGL